jgi:hypothetical protein
METIAGYPFYPLEISKDGVIFSAAQQAAVLDAATAAGADQLTDLVVISHGWNNDMAEARQLYNGLISSMARLAVGPRAPAAGGRRLATVGIFWPAKRFADEDLIPAGGVASIRAAAASGRPVPTAAIRQKLDALKGTFDRPDEQALERAKTLVDRLEDSPSAQREFVDLIRSVLPKPRDTLDDASDRFFARPGDQLLKDLAPPLRPRPIAEGGRGGAAALGAGAPKGGAAGLGDVFSGIKSAAWRLLNYATYYQMKERAGVVGGGLNGVLAAVRAARPTLRLHLIGHSFGARVVTAAADGPAALQPSSLTLLQAAFSHNGFTAKFDERRDGFFRKIVAANKIAGPIVVTHTVNDTAVGIAYPIASRIAGDKTAALGDENDVFGGLGRNGAVKMQASEFVHGALLGEDGRYAFTPGKVHNLRSDQHIASHGDVTNLAVANAVLAAVGL